ncbi:MAG: serine protease [Bacteroidaceae bacterium]|nr:serine protease [Bacteroidaceae bacterium]
MTILFFSIALCAHAKPNEKKAMQGMITVTSFDGQGKELRTGNGFFINQQGEALSTFDIFKNAHAAEITDAQGQKWKVTRICGANNLYNMVRFRTDCPSSTALPISEAQLAQKSAVYILPALGGKAKKAVQTTVRETSMVEGLNYYTLEAKLENTFAGCPILDAKGQVIAMMQANQSRDNEHSYGLDIALSQQLTTSGMSATEIALNNIHIAKQLPDSEPQARTFICLMPQNNMDTVCYLTALQDYITAYPDQPTGYTQRALYWASVKEYDKADADYNTALQNVQNKADIHYEKSKLIYRLNMFPDYEKYSDWDMQKAVQEIDEAYALESLPIFLMQKADCHFALKQYDEAFRSYQQVNQSPLASAQTFSAAAISAEMSRQDSTIILALLDSAVNRYGKPYPKTAALSLLQRATHLDRYGRYKEAAQDYQAVEELRGHKNLNDNFYFIKFQCDTKARLYPIALQDIEKALSYRPNDYGYTVEKALAEWRMGQFEEAVYTGQQAIKVNPNGADAYKAIGLALGEMGRKAEALKNLRKAKELGDPQAESLIQSLQ